MNNQIHKRLTNDQVKTILERYCLKEIKADQAQDLLEIKRSQFFELAKRYRRDPKQFSIQSDRANTHRKIVPDIEKSILKELKKDKALIKNKVRRRHFPHFQIKNIW